ncbi:MAG: single-stranded DNA-binding protein [Saprospiraceae bacterium]|nr:single-stranded DNA-binding protein [Candidatus Brachybacter algidus]
MNALKNKVQLIGNLGQIPEVKHSMAAKNGPHKFSDKRTVQNASGELVNEATWHTLIAWGKTAEIAEKYLEKGKEIAVEGKLVNRNYTDKNGIKKYVTEIQISELLMLGLTKKAV